MKNFRIQNSDHLITGKVIKSEMLILLNYTYKIKNSAKKGAAGMDEEMLIRDIAVIERVIELMEEEEKLDPESVVFSVTMTLSMVLNLVGLIKVKMNNKSIKEGTPEHRYFSRQIETEYTVWLGEENLKYSDNVMARYQRLYGKKNLTGNATYAESSETESKK